MRDARLKVYLPLEEEPMTLFVSSPPQSPDPYSFFQKMRAGSSTQGIESFSIIGSPLMFEFPGCPFLPSARSKRDLSPFRALFLPPLTLEDSHVLWSNLSSDKALSLSRFQDAMKFLYSR